ncbi:hypothetical protein PybrP1_000574 [[Pythium] brassicae (nom. inval.)]|nr:hypothetical protein PybrP1_000574 [[Pythium] brassicae (nom. inval.)]
MGSSLSVCGLGPSADDRRLQHSSSQSRHHPFEREKVMELLSHTDRARSLSVTTDSSVASILSNSDRLIPDAFMPVDIQVVSQRRVRPASSRAFAAVTASHSGGGNHATPAKGSAASSHYYNNSAHANAAFLRYMMTSSTSASTAESAPFSTSDRFVLSRRRGGAESGGSSMGGEPPGSVHPRLHFADEDSGALSSSRSSRSSRRSGNHSGVSARDLVKGYA